MSRWSFIGRGYEGDPFVIDGINVWEHPWSSVFPQGANVRDPIDGRKFVFDVFQVIVGDRRLLFAAGEFSTCQWGFYVPAPAEIEAR